MSCKRFERLLALSVEGDLPERQASRLKKHRARCPACREFAEGLWESQAAVKALAGERLGEPVFQELRGRIFHELASGRAGPRRKLSVPGLPSWRWSLGLAASATAAMLAAVALHLLRPEAARGPRGRPQPEARQSALPPPAPTGVEWESLQRRIAAKAGRSSFQALDPRARQIGREVEPLEKLPSEDLVVKLMTDDPDVVIIWLVSPDGGSP